MCATFQDFAGKHAVNMQLLMSLVPCAWCRSPWQEGSWISFVQAASKVARSSCAWPGLDPSGSFFVKAILLGRRKCSSAVAASMHALT